MGKPRNWKQLFLFEFQQRVCDIDGQLWHDNLLSVNKLDSYRLFKTNLVCEQYILLLDKHVYISVLAKFRCSGHKLLVEQGRHANLSRDLRICKLCDLNEVEDERHFLLKCPFFSDLRTLYGISVKHHHTLATMFSKLMTSVNVNVLRNVCRFLLSAQKRRDTCDVVL